MTKNARGAWPFIVITFALLSLGVSARESERELDAEPNPAPGMSWTRGHIVEMAAEGVPKLKDKLLSLDLGLKPVLNGDSPICRIEEPRQNIQSEPYQKAIKLAWPFDFYANSLPTDKKSDGEANIFWVGDDRNRNGERNDPHDKTMSPHAAFSECLKFSELTWSKLHDQFIEFFTFTRGTRDADGQINFQGLVTTKTYLEKGECKAYAELCLKFEGPVGSKKCKTGEPKYKLAKIIADIDYNKAWWETVKLISETQKHDVTSLRAVVYDIDEKTGLAAMNDHTITIAEKQIFNE
jgi:hypothetical protein